LERTSDVQSPPANRRPSLLQIFKYSVFLIVLGNLLFYFVEDLTAFFYLDVNASLADVAEAFAVTIDYTAWMVLIVLFEMESTAHARDAYRGARKWVFSGLTAACYAVLVYAAYGYVADLVDLYEYGPIASESLCDLVEDDFGYLDPTYRPFPLTAENCALFSSERVYRSPKDQLIATHANLMAIQKLGWVAIANAAAWLLVVLIFQIEISLKQLDKLTKFRLTLCTATKAFLYLVLIADAIYWTIYSAFIDFWDAWIWLVAFMLIDLNLLGVDDSTED
jgi:hypothetical protein